METNGDDRPLSRETVYHCLQILQRAQEQNHTSVEQSKAAKNLCHWLNSLDVEDSSDTDESLDAPSRALLADYRCSERFSRTSLADFADLMGTSPSVRSVPPSLLARKKIGQEALNAEMDQLADWSNFNVFRVRDLSEGWPLTTIVSAIVERFDLIDKLQLDKEKLTSFLKEVECSYKDNPYHNSTHAADVTQSLGCLLSNDDFSTGLTDLEILSMIIAAAVHDVGHPGVSNDFLVNSTSSTALEYNDIHVNENMHAALAFKIYLRSGNSFLPESLDSQLYRFFRRTVISIVLATDMAGHEELMHDFQSGILKFGNDVAAWHPEKKIRFMQAVVHCADIANPAKPIQFCTQWSKRVLEEFFAQGDREKKEGLPISPHCDREQVNCARSQLVFLERVVRPCYTTLKQVAPNSADTALQHVETACSHWEEILQKDAQD